MYVEHDRSLDDNRSWKMIEVSIERYFFMTDSLSTGMHRDFYRCQSLRMQRSFYNRKEVAIVLSLANHIKEYTLVFFFFFNVWYNALQNLLQKTVLLETNNSCPETENFYLQKEEKKKNLCFEMRLDMAYL